MVSLSTVLDETIVRILIAGALGLFLGLEREWSQKTAGIRTFSLISLLGAVFTVLDSDPLLVVGGTLVIALGIMLAVRGLLDADETGLSLTTSVSMLVAYGVGALVAEGAVLAGVTVAVLSSVLLVLKRELHDFAWGLSRPELRSVTEFAVLAFVVYPLLPATYPVTVGSVSLDVEPQVIWLMVVTVAGIGVVNYAVVSEYGGRGIAITGFFGGLASSTAVIGTMMDHLRQHETALPYAIAAVMLADAAMAVRNLAIALAFTYPNILVDIAVPLLAVTGSAIVIAAIVADWSTTIELDLESPFSMRNALGFGAVFLVIVVAGGLAKGLFGTAGLFVTAALSGLVSSAGATTSAVVLYRGGTIGSETATVAILLATATSILVKAGLTALGPDRAFARKVAVGSVVVLVTGVVATLVVIGTNI
jgi:uncharacterized membrane protein (DUF4010 family)